MNQPIQVYEGTGREFVAPIFILCRYWVLSGTGELGQDCFEIAEPPLDSDNALCRLEKGEYYTLLIKGNTNKKTSVKNQKLVKKAYHEKNGSKFSGWVLWFEGTA